MPFPDPLLVFFFLEIHLRHFPCPRHLPRLTYPGRVCDGLRCVCSGGTFQPWQQPNRRCGSHQLCGCGEGERDADDLGVSDQPSAVRTLSLLLLNSASFVGSPTIRPHNPCLRAVFVGVRRLLAAFTATKSAMKVPLGSARASSQIPIVYPLKCLPDLFKLPIPRCTTNKCRGPIY